MIAIAVFVGLLALSSAVPLDTEQIQIVNLPSTDDVSLEDDGSQQIAAAHLPIFVNLGVDVATEESEEDSTDAPQQVEIAHLPAFVNPGLDVAVEESEDDTADAPQQIEIVHLPAVVNPEIDVAAEESEDDTADAPQQVEIAHLPAAVNPGIDVAVSDGDDELSNVIEQIAAAHLPIFIIPGVDVATEEEEKTETQQVEISHLPSFVVPGFDVQHNEPELSYVQADENPCAACFAYMTKLIDELTASVSVDVSPVKFPNVREVPEEYEDAPSVPMLRPVQLPSHLSIMRTGEYEIGHLPAVFPTEE